MPRPHQDRKKECCFSYSVLRKMLLHCAPGSLDFSSLVKYWDRKQPMPWVPGLRSKDLVYICAATRPRCTMGIGGGT